MLCRFVCSSRSHESDRDAHRHRQHGARAGGAGKFSPTWESLKHHDTPAWFRDAKLSAQGFNEGKGKPFTAADVWFTEKGNVFYAIVLGSPTNGVSIKSLGQSAKLLDQPVKRIEMLGSREKISWQQNADALEISLPKNLPNNFADVFKISLRGK